MLCLAGHHPRPTKCQCAQVQAVYHGTGQVLHGDLDRLFMEPLYLVEIDDFLDCLQRDCLRVIVQYRLVKSSNCYLAK